MIWLILIPVLILILLGYFIVPLFPIVTGFSAKEMCSGVFLGGRDPEEISKLELGIFPLNQAKVEVNREEKSVTASLFGFARQKAIYREGLGSTLLSGESEAKVRKLNFVQVQRRIVSNPELPWPQGQALVDPLPSEVDFPKLEAALDWAFSNPKPKAPHNTLAVVVIHNGRLIAERYANGITAENPLTGWSMTKSITNALVGILVKQGKMELDQAAGFSEWAAAGDPRAEITLRHLLQMSSSLKWSEEYSNGSDVVDMLFKTKSSSAYALQKKLEGPVGSIWKYASGTTNLISLLIQNLFEQEEEYYSFPRKVLFDPLGMSTAVMEVDASGTFVGSSFCFATARDWAKFGQLYLNDGVWEGKRILPASWVDFSVTPAPNAPLGQYGAHFWLNAGEKGHPEQRNMPDVPADCYMCQGYNGQSLSMIPSQDLVVLRLGVNKELHFLKNDFLKRILKAF